VDETTGNLVLLSERNGKIDLPPLRLDDVVVIFRSVYLHGEGPSVTINPRPDNPHGPIMDVVHGMATPDTYVGWVLFEVDRIMKCYNQGEDNVTRKPLSSAVPDHKAVLDTVYFGGDFADGRKPGGNWERFWIVPAEVTRYHADSGELTLFDVPLKVNTQKMVLRKGKLEDDPNGKSSKGALAFIEWFTRHFEGIAQEQYLQPPAESGLTKPVPIYAELRRIALTTAIAEQLRDQGVPMPFWMRDYPVRRIPIVSTTPSLTTTREKHEVMRTLTAQIYGGVNLSPADSVVRNVRSAEDTQKLPAAQREAAVKEIAVANTLASSVAAAATAQPPLMPFAVSTPEREVTAASLPGAESTALAPCRLDEEDLAVTGDGGVRLPLLRHFNSFFQPNGELGRGWTLDLPRLDRTVVPTERTDYGGKSTTVPELLTPLNTLYARFSREDAVPQLGVRLHVPDKPCEILALAGANNPLVPAAKSKVIFRDGRSWLFDAEGRFVAEEAKPITTVYWRDETGRVTRISGHHGDREAAAMRLDYDGQGRLRAAIPLDPTEATIPHENEKRRGLLASLFGGHRKTETANEPGKFPEGGAAFDYDENGMLASVTTPDGKVTYTYQNGLVAGVSRVPKGDDAANAQPRIRRFEYAANGQLASEITPDGTRISYNIRQHEGKHQVCIGTEGAQVVADYDPANRPLALREADGTQTTWQYAEDDAVAAETVLPTGESSRMTLSGDRRQRTVSTSEGPAVREVLDDAGRTVKFSVEKTPVVGEAVPLGADVPMEDVFTQQWRPDGLPGATHFATHAIIPEYDEHGRVKRVMRVKPTGSDRFSEWQETCFDAAGRVTEVKDCAKGKVAIGYDADSNIASVTTTRVGAEQQEEQVSYDFTRDAHGRITGVNSPGGLETCEYDASGDPSTVLVKRGQSEARIEFSEGRPRRLTQFDGGRIEFDYNDEGPAKGQLRTVHTPVVKLDYRYDAGGALAEVACGDACRVIYGYDGDGNLASLEYCPAADLDRKESHVL
jgi:YD repeat-containing protein